MRNGRTHPTRLPRQVDVGETQHHERTRGVLRQASVAHLGKAPEPLDHGEDMFDPGEDFGLVVVPERSTSSILPPLRTRWLVRSRARGAFDSINTFWLA